METMELAVLDWIQVHLRCGFLDAVLPWISGTADHGEVWILLAAVLLLLRRQRRYGAAVACGLVLAVAALSPVVRLDLGAGERWLEEYFAGLDSREEALREQVDRGIRPIIEEEYAAYIVDKAAQQGLSCSVRVTCEAGEDGLYLPVRVEVAGVRSQGERAAVAGILAELGVPEEGQIYEEREETP